MNLLRGNHSTKTTLLVAVFVVAQIALLGLFLLAFEILATVESASRLHGRWDGAREDALDQLQRYAASGRRGDLSAFRTALALPLSLRELRLELQSVVPDPPTVSRILATHEIETPGVPGLFRLLHSARTWPDFSTALQIWEEADQLILRLESIGEQLAGREQDRPEITPRQALLDEAQTANERLIGLQRSFATYLADGIRSLRRVLTGAVVGAVALFVLAGVAVARVLHGRTQHELRSIRESENRHRVLAEAANVGIWRVGHDGDILYMNPAMCSLLQVDSPGVFLGEPYPTLLSDEGGRMLLRELAPLHVTFTSESAGKVLKELAKAARGGPAVHETELQGLKGARRRALVTAVPLLSATGKVESYLCTATRSPQREDREPAPPRSDAARSSHIPALVWTTDADLRVTSCQGNELENLDLDPETATGLPITRALGGEETFLESAHRRALEGETTSGVERWDGRLYQIRLEPLRDEAGVANGCLGIAGRLAERRAGGIEPAEEWSSGPFARLLDRSSFERELESRLDDQERHGDALLWLDLDRFRSVRDQLGPSEAEELVLEVGESVQDLVRENDLLSRLAGDEFALLLRDTDPRHAQAVARRLLDEVASYRLLIDGKPRRLTVSIGIVLPSQHRHLDELFADAQMAVNQAKSLGGSRAVLLVENRQVTVESAAVGSSA